MRRITGSAIKKYKINNVDNTKQSPFILSLCSGMRGLERGIERACVRLNWTIPKTIAYVEIESFIAWNLVKQMEQGVLDPAPVFSNLKTFNWSFLRGKIHGITGGYPCQPFSVAGKRQGTKDPRHLWPYIKEGIRTIRPVWCFFENVPGHLTMGYREVKSELEGLGYTVKEGIYSAEEVGAPHRRERLFILAIKQSELGNTKKSNKQRTWLCESSAQRSIRRSGYGKLANPSLCGIKQFSECEPGQEWSEQIESIYAERCSRNMADPNNSGSQGWHSAELQECFSERIIRKSDSWPSRPNEPQHEWEPRRVESRMGYTFNGYNFREDLLRMVGNGVVEATAEIAFIDLLKKHKLI